MSYPFTATSYTNLNIIQNGNFKEYSLRLLNSGNISFNTDITLNFTLVGGGGGGGVRAGGGRLTRDHRGDVRGGARTHGRAHHAALAVRAVSARPGLGPRCLRCLVDQG